ncbi:MAG: histidine phosphatase family protein [Clostridia bacterium]|nr:histidine phosphatase family protein [Clostridia bacterium]
MTLYIIRHADPDYANNTITEFGWEEANALGEWMKDVKIDRIYSSPLGRALDTAAPTCKEKGLEPIILPWTAESMDYMDSHRFTPESNCSYSFSLQKGIYDFKDNFEDNRMATVENMIKNSDEFLASCGYSREGAFYRITNHNDDCIAVFCHGGFGVAWISHLLNTAPGVMYPGISLNTTSVTTFVFRNSDTGFTRPCLKRLGEIDHIRRAGLRINNR